MIRHLGVETQLRIKEMPDLGLEGVDGEGAGTNPPQVPVSRATAIDDNVDDGHKAQYSANSSNIVAAYQNRKAPTLYPVDVSDVTPK